MANYSSDDEIYQKWFNSTIKVQRSRSFLFPYFDDSKRIGEICEAAAAIRTVYLWLWFALGIPGNILTIITTLTMQAMTPATFFVALLAFFDGAALLVKVIYVVLIDNKIPMGDTGCKMQFLPIYLSIVANWMLVLICAERCISVCFPLKKISIVTKKRSYVTAAVLSAVLLALIAPIFMFMRGETKGSCYIYDKFVIFWSTYWYWINAALYLFIPSLLIFILTAAIIRGLYLSRRDRKILMQKGSGRVVENETSARNNQRMLAEAARVERAITIMMILAAVFFVTFALPACVYNLMPRPQYRNCGSTIASAHWAIFRQIQHLMADATHAFNFFMYFFAAKRFRNQLFKLFRRCICRKEMFKMKHQQTRSTDLSNSGKLSGSVNPLPLLK